MIKNITEKIVYVGVDDTDIDLFESQYVVPNGVSYNSYVILDEKIAIIKHALNVTNATAKVQVGDAEMSIDTILIKMAQLNKRKSVLDVMRKQLPKARVEQHAYMSRNSVPEYKYINYDLELIKKEYESVSVKIMELQMALDKYNQTVQFEVDI